MMVVLTLPGFPAYALLEPGDVIVGFADQPIQEKVTATLFQQLIRRHQAGEELNVTVVRDGVAESLRFRLGNGQALGAVYDSTGVALNRSYQERWFSTRERMLALTGGNADGSTDKNGDSPTDPAE